MTEVLHDGDKLLITHRRLFAGDDQRWFVGEVAGYDAGIIKLVGHTYVREPTSGHVLAKSDLRTRLYSLASGTILVYQLPDETDIASVAFENREGSLWVGDGRALDMNLTERVTGWMQRT